MAWNESQAGGDRATSHCLSFAQFRLAPFCNVHAPRAWRIISSRKEAQHPLLRFNDQKENDSTN
jgi:hypothetical protein